MNLLPVDGQRALGGPQAAVFDFKPAIKGSGEEKGTSREDLQPGQGGPQTVEREMFTF